MQVKESNTIHDKPFVVNSVINFVIKMMNFSDDELSLG